MKKNALKTIKMLSLLMLVAMMVVGCSSGKTEQPAAKQEPAKTEPAKTEPVKEEKALVLGLDDTFAPMGFRDEKGNIVGFDIDLANEAAKRIGVTLKFQPIDWSMKETELNGKNIDFIWNGYTITEERKEKVAFSKPYLENSQIIVTLAESPVKTKADLKGKVVAVQAESSALDAVNAEPDFVKTLKDLVEFSTNNEAFNDLEAKRSDALVVDEVLARYYMKQKGQEKYKVLDEDFGDEEYGVGLRKEDTELLKKLDAALDEMKKDGTYEKIYAKWFSEN
jgi:polar amino acid transport system substrate-binding protein